MAFLLAFFFPLGDPRHQAQGLRDLGERGVEASRSQADKPLPRALGSGKAEAEARVRALLS